MATFTVVVTPLSDALLQLHGAPVTVTHAALVVQRTAAVRESQPAPDHTTLELTPRMVRQLRILTHGAVMLVPQPPCPLHQVITAERGPQHPVVALG